MSEPNWDELVDEMLDAEEFDGRDTARAAILAAIQKVVGERDETKLELESFQNKYRDAVDMHNKQIDIALTNCSKTNGDLRAANETCDRLATSRNVGDKLECNFCDGWAYEWEGEQNVSHSQDCPVFEYRARVNGGDA